MRSELFSKDTEDDKAKRKQLHRLSVRNYSDSRSRLLMYVVADSVEPHNPRAIFRGIEKPNMFQ